LRSACGGLRLWLGCVCQTRTTVSAQPPTLPLPLPPGCALRGQADCQQPTALRGGAFVRSRRSPRGSHTTRVAAPLRRCLLAPQAARAVMKRRRLWTPTRVRAAQYPRLIGLRPDCLARRRERRRLWRRGRRRRNCQPGLPMPRVQSAVSAMEERGAALQGPSVHRRRARREAASFYTRMRSAADARTRPAAWPQAEHVALAGAGEGSAGAAAHAPQIEDRQLMPARASTPPAAHAGGTAARRYFCATPTAMFDTCGKQCKPR
jgi:hypothetical protein